MAEKKVSEYIADFLVANGVTDLFTVVGGGAMHLNDSFGHKDGLRVVYCHHEQAAAIASESYARVAGRPAAVCVTSGPGATNAMTGCLCGYMGSVPMLIFSGQVRYAATVRSTGLALRTMGEQEYDICRSAAGMTKYCEMVTEPRRIRYCLEKALYLAKAGRPGPCWLDIPLDVQAAMVETEELPGYDPAEDAGEVPPLPDDALLVEVLERIAAAERPVIYIGQGVRSAGACGDVRELAQRLGVPIVTGMTTVDVIPDDFPYYAGRSGATGDRAGNFAVQNSDLLLSIGSRLSYKQVGYNTEAWARCAYKIMVDIDAEELKKPHLHIDLPLWCDAGTFIRGLLRHADGTGGGHAAWVEQCRQWVRKYPVVTEAHYRTPDGLANIYAFYRELTKLLPEGNILVTTSGTSRVVARQAAIIKEGQRIITNHSTSPMGYCLPASVGACVANQGRPVVLVTGEGGFQMNIQELQTIVQNRLPVRIVVVNNGGYHSIRMTQNNFFKERSHVGIGAESGDLSFPDLEKIAYAYGLKYFEVRNNAQLRETLTEFLECQSYALCQVFVTTTQVTLPKVSSKKLPDGTMVSATLEDMSPFLPDEELQENMYIPLWGK